MFALKYLDRSLQDRVVTVPPTSGKSRNGAGARAAISRLGVLPVRSNSEEQGLIGAIAAALRSSNPAVADDCVRRDA